jgi:hypothetical protein
LAKLAINESNSWYFILRVLLISGFLVNCINSTK